VHGVDVFDLDRDVRATGAAASSLMTVSCAVSFEVDPKVMTQPRSIPSSRPITSS